MIYCISDASWRDQFQNSSCLLGSHLALCLPFSSIFRHGGVPGKPPEISAQKTSYDWLSSRWTTLQQARVNTSFPFGQMPSVGALRSHLYWLSCLRPLLRFFLEKPFAAHLFTCIQVVRAIRRGAPASFLFLPDCNWRNDSTNMAIRSASHLFYSRINIVQCTMCMQGYIIS